jgi:hypothetical protein
VSKIFLSIFVWIWVAFFEYPSGDWVQILTSTMQAVRTLIPRAGRQQLKQARFSSLSSTSSTSSLVLLSARRAGGLIVIQRSYATEPTTKPANETLQHETLHLLLNTTAKSSNKGMAGPEEVPGSIYNPYKDGPSALDKAMTMFLFTELVRGR